MTPDEALEYFGTKSEMARQLDVTTQHVYNFFSRGRISLPCQRKIEALSGGQLKATKMFKEQQKAGLRQNAKTTIFSSTTTDTLLLTQLGDGNRSAGLRKLVIFALENNLIQP